MMVLSVRVVAEAVMMNHNRKIGDEIYHYGCVGQSYAMVGKKYEMTNLVMFVLV